MRVTHFFVEGNVFHFGDIFRLNAHELKSNWHMLKTYDTIGKIHNITRPVLTARSMFQTKEASP